MAGSVTPIIPAIVAEVAIGLRRLSLVLMAIASAAAVWAKVLQNSRPLMGSKPFVTTLLMIIGAKAQCMPKIISSCQIPDRMSPAAIGLRLYTHIAASAMMLLTNVATGPTPRKTTGDTIINVRSGTKNSLIEE
ncbi:hypothetical protein D3C73_1145500 [compost metagenome]